MAKMVDTTAIFEFMRYATGTYQKLHRFQPT